MKSIGFRLVSIMLCVILFGIGITVGVSMVISGGVISKEALSGVRHSTEREGNGMNAWLSCQQESINTLAATLSQLEDFSKEQQVKFFNAVLDQNEETFDVYMGYPNGEATFGSGYVPDYSRWQANERGWYKLAMTDTSRTHITSPYIDVQTNELCITVSRAVNRDGELLGVVSSDILITTLKEMVLNTTLDSNGYAMLLDSNGDILVHPDLDFAPNAEGEFQNLATIKNNIYANLWDAINKEDEAVKDKGPDGMEYYTSCTLKATGWHLVTVLPVEVVTKPIVTVIWIVVPLTLSIIILAAIIIFLIVRNLINKPVSELCEAADGLADGDIGISVSSNFKYEMGLLAKAFQRIADSINMQVLYAKDIASGDLTADVTVRSEHDVMGHALRHLQDSLNNMFAGINTGTAQVSEGARHLADGAQAVAQGSTKQASAVEYLSEGIRTLSEKTAQNTRMASEASGLAGEVRTDAEKGNLQMTELLSAVREINDASHSIEKVIKVIDDIAFQTNILALNASVEAARAGIHGKGFAVVAEEVRDLAGKSAEAAKDTGNLIRSSIEKAALGTGIAEETSKSLQGIVEGINKSATIVNEIAQLSKEQSSSINEITEGISQVSQVIQQNSSIAQESAASSEEMSVQSDILSDLVSSFKLRKEGKYD